MIRGTTPTHVFVLPIEVSKIRELRITYKQMDRIVLEKTEKEVKMDGSTVQFTLTQEESLAFRKEYAAKVQMKVLTDDGVVLASPVKELKTSEILNEEVLG